MEEVASRVVVGPVLAPRDRREVATRNVGVLGLARVALGEVGRPMNNRPLADAVGAKVPVDTSVRVTVMAHTEEGPARPARRPADADRRGLAVMGP